MKKTLILSLCLFFCANVFALNNFVGDNVSGLSGFGPFSSDDPYFSLNAPLNWELKDNKVLSGFYPKESRHYLWRGPRNSVFGPGYTALLITITPKTTDLKGYADNLINERLPEDGKIISSTSSSLAGAAAYEAMISYRSLLGAKSFPSPISYRKVIWIIAEKDNFFYDLRYSAEEADFDAYFSVYKEAKKSFKY
jgi:hypothetical protein